MRGKTAVGRIAVCLALALLTGCSVTYSAVAPAPTPTVAEEVPRIAPQELKAALDAGTHVTVVDARSLEAFNAEHIRGAISLPLTELEQRHNELAKNEAIVFYCT